MRGVTEWLESIGLHEYARRFAENGVDLSVVRDLTEQDLKDLGVLLGHRRKILRAIAELDDTTRPKAGKMPAEGERRRGQDSSLLRLQYGRLRPSASGRDICGTREQSRGGDKLS